MAAHLFGAQTWVTSGCAGGLLALNMARRQERVLGRAPPKVPWFSLLCGLGLLCAVLAQWVVSPRIVAREDLQLWHRLGSGMYLVQWLCSLAVFQLLVRRALGRARLPL
jgi:hypothetical protein